jgi:hypothetical protein
MTRQHAPTHSWLPASNTPYFDLKDASAPAQS